MLTRQKLQISLLKIADLVVLAVSIAAAVTLTVELTAHGPNPHPLEMRFSLPEILGALVFLWLAHFILVARGLYESYRFAAATRELRDVTIAMVACASLLVPFALAVHPRLETLLFVGCFAAIGLVMLGAERRGLRALARRLRRSGRNLRNVLIVSVAEGSPVLAAKLARREELGLHVVGVIATAGDGSGAFEQDVARIRQAVESQPLDELLVDLPIDRAQALVQRLIDVCEDHGVTVRILTRVAQLHWGHAMLDELDGEPVLTVSSAPSDPVQLVAKRAIDVTTAVVGLVLLSPLFVLIGMAIKLESRGPVFFGQERIGCNHRLFTTYKFRTMTASAPAMQSVLEGSNEANGPVFKIRSDPRVTAVGRWLRRSSLDELPQLFNVLRGEMSLVGPRPLPVRDVLRFQVPWHHRRFSVRPGITCAWQATQRTPDFEPWVRSDLEYIKHWSLALDLKILMQTIPAVVSGRGAY